MFARVERLLAVAEVRPEHIRHQPQAAAGQRRQKDQAQRFQHIRDGPDGLRHRAREDFKSRRLRVSDSEAQGRQQFRPVVQEQGLGVRIRLPVLVRHQLRIALRRRLQPALSQTQRCGGCG